MNTLIVKQDIVKQDVTDEMPYSCGICDKKFKWPRDLKWHQMVHTGEKPYACNYCNKKFNRPGSVKDHEMTHTG